MEEVNFRKTLTGLFSHRRSDGCRIKRRCFLYRKAILFIHGLLTVSKFRLCVGRLETLLVSVFLKGIQNLKNLERIKFFPESKLINISKRKLVETLDNILFLMNLMVELRDLTQEFENKLRLREEINFVKYLTKFLKDLIDGIRYLRKLSSQMHLKISNFAI